MAKNPYTVLGVSEDASPEDIRKAYLDLVRKYHPDRYRDNPLAELAQEKLKEINEAYDTIQRQPKRAAASSGAERSGPAWDEGDSGATGVYAQVEAYIRANNIAAAQQLLHSITERNAEWFYYSGLVAMRQGWYSTADEYFARASSMEPNNARYAAARQQAASVNARYRGKRQTYNTGRVMDDGCLNTCMSLYCMDCCCESMGGDCIPCC